VLQRLGNFLAVALPVADAYLDVSRDLEVIEALTETFLDRYDPDLFVVDDATVMVERISKLSRQFEAAKMRTARRLERVDSYKDEGYKDAASWLSAITGEPVGQAAGKLETSRALEAHPEVSQAFNTAKISLAQAKEIASAADRCPNEAADLVERAGFMNHTQLKKLCGAIRHASYSADDEITRHESIRKARFCRTWTDSLGAGHLEAKMTPDALAVVLAGLGNFETRIFCDARKSGKRESHQAYMADALVAMARASVTPSADRAGSDGYDSSDGSSDDVRDPGTKRRRTFDPKALMRIRVDADAFFRGYAEPGETCEIPGVGPVPVASARAVLGEAILELVIKKGTDVTTVVSDSRYVTKALRIALEERDPVCVVPTCNKSDPLERDHWQVDYSDKGPTSIDNLARLCPWHHDQKTHRGWRLEGGPGQWRFTKPDRSPRADGVEATDGTDPDPQVSDTPGARPARRREAPGTDPPHQEPLL